VINETKSPGERIPILEGLELDKVKLLNVWKEYAKTTTRLFEVTEMAVPTQA